jgi:glutamate/tyrosine decarboxylase-like PLP-dependent enzyme
MANFVGLASARRWYGEHHGVDVEKDGLSRLPPVPVFSSGYIHASAEKAIAMLGIGTGRIRRLVRDDAGRLDEEALERELAASNGPAIVIATAGEVNAGGFDPIAAMADLAERYGAWLHVDGAFGLFARVTPEAAALAEGVERAHSVIADGHKWLNVPYECGFAFVREQRYQAGAFAAGAPYLTSPEARPMWAFLGPEMSRRSRAFATWATLRAYGRAGHRAMVERHLALARRVGEQVEAAPELELLAPVELNVICFRLHPPGMDDEQSLDELNRRVGAAVIEDARVYFGTTVYRGHVCFRPAIVNWLTTERDVDLIVETTRELASVVA